MATESTLKSKLESKGAYYDKLVDKWRKADILYRGEDAVHEASDFLLPRLQSQDDEDYAGYVERARFLNIFRRTINGLEGTVMRRQPNTNLEDMPEQYVIDIDAAGTTAYEYIGNLLNCRLKFGVSGTLVDYTRVDDSDELTVAEAEQLGLRPKICFYPPVSIYDLRYGVVEGKKKLILVKLKETYLKQEDEFTYKEYDLWRVLRLNEKGKYVQRLYKETGGGIEIGEEIMPVMNDEPFTTIPFYLDGAFEEPPMYDLITTNIKHYQLKADHAHGLHYIALPTPWRAGVDMTGEHKLPNVIGPTIIWDSENENFNCGYLEFEGKGMQHIVDELETMKEEMAFLGAAMLATDKMVNETATKATYRNASETASLAELVQDSSNTVAKVFTMYLQWAGARDNGFYFEFNNDFDIAKLSAQDILARVQSWQAGAFSKQSLYKQLKAGEVELEGDTFEDEEALSSGVGAI